MTSIAFIGFGEAAQAVAQGLASERSGVKLSAYDPRFSDRAHAPSLREAATRIDLKAGESLGEAIGSADIVLSLVVGSAAVKVGEAAGQVLRRGQTFIDLNSISPDGKTRVRDALLKGGNADFVEGAVMARVPPLKHKVPILLAGPVADAAARQLNAVGMSCEAVGDRIGQACAVKMVRSIFVKGIEALLIESLSAAEAAGVRERILDSISETFPGLDWRETATYYVGRTMLHGARRVTEMNEAAETLRFLGLQPILASAISQTIGQAHAKFGTARLPKDADYVAMVSALAGTEQKAAVAELVK